QTRSYAARVGGTIAPTSQNNGKSRTSSTWVELPGAASIDDESRRIGLQRGDDLGHDLADLGRVARDVASRVLERLDLRRRRSLAAGDDRPGVTHLLARRRGDAGDVRDDRLPHLVLHELGRFLLG